MTAATQPDAGLPLDREADLLVELSTLRAEVVGLRTIAADASYWHGTLECFEGECDCPEYVDEEGEPRPGLDRCPTIEVRHARSVDLFVREQLEQTLTELLDMLAADVPPDWTDVREELHNGIRQAAEVDDPRGLPRSDLYQRVAKADHEDTLLTLATSKTQEGQ